MKYVLPLAALAVLTACNQTEAEPTAEELAVCEGLDDAITTLQKRHSAELNEAVLMRQMQAQGQLDPAAGDPGDMARFSMLQYEARLNNVLVMMQGHGCDLPTEPVEGVIYSQAAGRCLQARASGSAEAASLCEMEDWEPNPGSGGDSEDSDDGDDSETDADAEE
ncbi:hypothetical protein [Aurantiacibacter gilvus]|uniref:Lipoprotein n=1 Tax=Aurantiacibacter gilvus TaxID=3139141 RepID=A0ABU9IDR6_9SPHN